MIKVFNTTTGELLFQSEEKVNVAIHVGDYERARLTANPKTIGVYVRDLKRDRPEISIIRERFGAWVKMEI